MLNKRLLHIKSNPSVSVERMRAQNAAKKAKAVADNLDGFSASYSGPEVPSDDTNFMTWYNTAAGEKYIYLEDFPDELKWVSFNAIDFEQDENAPVIEIGSNKFRRTDHGWARVSDFSSELTMMGNRAETVNALKQKAGFVDKQIISLVGYHSPNDGGGGLLFWDSDSEEDPNDGSIFQVDGVVTGRWKRVMPESVNVKMFGASPNRTPLQNYISIKNAIESHDKILIEESYDISPINGSPIKFDGSLSIKSETRKGELHFVSGARDLLYTEGADNVDINGLKMFGPDDEQNGSVKFVLFVSPTAYVERVNITRCAFNGLLRAVHSNSTVPANPETDYVGIRFFSYTYNEGNNLFNTHINIVNNVTEVTIITHNVVTNFNYVFCNSAVSNINISNRKKLFFAEHNKVFNEPGYWPAKDPGSYFAFVLFQGIKAVYRYNIVEGMKSTYNSSLYDAYFGAYEVYYTDNKWINNIRFGTSTINAHIVKSKGDSTLNPNDDRVPVRRYNSNEFRVEKSWLTAIGKTTDDAWVNLFNIADNSDFEFIGNNVDVPGLSVDTSSETYNSFTIENNTFNIDYIKTGSAFLNINNDKPQLKPSSFSGNSLVIKDYNSTFFFLSSQLGLVWDKFIFNNNNIDVKGSIDSILFFSNFVADKMLFSGNNISYRFRSFFGNTTIRSFVGSNNSIYSYHEGSRVLWDSANGSNNSLGQRETSINISFFLVDITLFRLPLYNNTDLLLDKVVRNFVSVKMNDDSGESSVSFTYDVEYKDGEYYINYVNSADTSRSVVIESGDDHNAFISASVQGSKQNMAVRLLNNIGCINLTNFSDNSFIELSIKSIQIPQ